MLSTDRIAPQSLHSIHAPLLPGERRQVVQTFAHRGRPVLHGVVEQPNDYPEGAGLHPFDHDLNEEQAVSVVVVPSADVIRRLDANRAIRMLLEIMGSATPAHLERSALQTL